MRIALLTLPSVMSADACLTFAEAAAGRLALIGLSNPHRAAMGGAAGQARRHLARSGPRILPYLALGFGPAGGAAGLRRLAPAVTVDDVNGLAMHQALRAARPDLIVTLHFDQILSAETLALAPLGGINMHPALLPRHRGPIPAFWALAKGEGRAGVSIHRLTPRIDAGAVLAQRAVTLPPGVSALAAARLLHLAGVPLLQDVVARLAAGEAVAGQEAPELPYCPFPDGQALQAAARRGVRLVTWRDLRLFWSRPSG
ncbi:formyltransferase family protein [Roseomonas sp. AR75]|uniref:formyltransferase family protein n=1 Tax=Roseomonas sp. AR75 TaxID=2562311 RepID=UPI0010C0F147|nr:formyltransferase family protein [Roseomonas sp. AR75]